MDAGEHDSTLGKDGHAIPKRSRQLLNPSAKHQNQIALGREGIVLHPSPPAIPKVEARRLGIA
jgi:hypothetical protein